MLHKPTKKVSLLRRPIGKINKEFSRKETQEFLNLLAELIGNGFTLEKSLDFLKMVMPKRENEIKEMKRNLLRGKKLATCLKSLKLTASQFAQLSFAEVHGDLVGTLLRMSQHISDKEKQRQHLIKVVSYPLLLLVFLSSMVLGMKWYILPQLAGLYEETDSRNLGLFFVNQSPLIVLFLLITGCIIYVSTKVFLKRKSAIYRANWLCQIPVLKPFLISYYTSLFATEWGKLLSQGMEFRDVVLVMNQKGYTSLMKEMAQTIEKQIENGISIDGPIKEWLFLKPELNLIVLQGGAKGDLGRELLIYGKREWQKFIDLSEKKMRFLQPAMFLLIAVLIISVYGALLLPIYSGMGDMY